jgi:hypothetical protein
LGQLATVLNGITPFISTPFCHHAFSACCFNQCMLQTLSNLEPLQAESAAVCVPAVILLCLCLRLFFWHFMHPSKSA